MFDDLKLELELKTSEAMAALKKFATEVDKTTKKSDGLKKKLGAINQTLRDTEKFESKLKTEAGKLNTKILESKTKLGELDEQLKKHKDINVKGAEATEKHARKLDRLKTSYDKTKKAIEKDNTALRTNQRLLTETSHDVDRLRNSQSRLKHSYDATRRAEQLQSASARRGAKRGAAFQSAGSAIARGGLRQGALISAGAALGTGGMGTLGSMLIAGGATLGIGSALFKSASTGMDLETNLADIMTRTAGRVDKTELKKVIKELNSRSPYDLGDVSSAFVTLGKSGVNDLASMKGVAESSLLFGQAEQLSATDATNKILKITHLLGKKTNAKDTNYIANLLSATATSAPTNVSEVFTALTSGGPVAKLFGQMDDYQLGGLLAVMAEHGYTGSAMAPLRTALLKEKGTKKVKDAQARLSDLTGGQELNLVSKNNVMLPLLDIIDSIETMQKQFAGNRDVQESLRAFLSASFGARGTDKLLAILMGGRKAILAKADEIKGLVEGGITQKLAEEKGKTTEYKLKFLVSEFSNTLESLFDKVLKGPIGDIAMSMKGDLEGIGRFIENNPEAMKEISSTINLTYTSIKAIASSVFRIAEKIAPLVKPILQGIAGTSVLIDKTLGTVLDTGSAFFTTGDVVGTARRGVYEMFGAPTAAAAEPGSEAQKAAQSWVDKSKGEKTRLAALRGSVISKLKNNIPLTNTDLGLLTKESKDSYMLDRIIQEGLSTTDSRESLGLKGGDGRRQIIDAAYARRYESLKNSRRLKESNIYNDNNININITGGVNATAEEVAEQVKKAFDGVTFSSKQRYIGDREIEQEVGLY